MLQQLSQDQVSIASEELKQYLESQVSMIAPEPQEDWSFITAGFRVEAQQAATNINQKARQKIEAELSIGRDFVEGKEKYTRPREFAGFRGKTVVSPADGRKAMRIFERFGGWALEKLVIISSAANLYTLCQAKFDGVVQQLFEASDINKELVQNLVKGVRDAARTERRKKQTDPVSGWRQDPSGGGRHYQLPPMYDEAAATKVERIAQERGVMPSIVVEEAIACFGETKSPSSEDLRRQFQEELQAAVSEMRDCQIEMQRQLIERDHQIAELETTIRNAEVLIVSVPEAEPEHELSVPEDELFALPSVPPPNVLATQLLRCHSWAEVTQVIDRVAEATGAERGTVFAVAAKCINPERRSHLIQLLAQHISEFPRDRGAYNWLPDSAHRLTEKAFARAGTLPKA